MGRKKYADGGYAKPTYMGAVKDRALEMIGRGPNVAKKSAGLVDKAAKAGSGRGRQVDDAVNKAQGYRDGGMVGKLVKKHKC